MALDICDAVVRIQCSPPKGGAALHVDTVGSGSFVCELATPEKPPNAIAIEDITGHVAVLNVVTRRVRNP